MGGFPNFRANNGAVINNAALFDVQSDATLLHASAAGAPGAIPTFNNTGTFRKSGGTGVTDVGFVFNSRRHGPSERGHAQPECRRHEHRQLYNARRRWLLAAARTTSTQRWHNISGAGTVRFSGGTTNLNGGTYNVTGGTQATGRARWPISTPRSIW